MSMIIICMAAGMFSYLLATLYKKKWDKNLSVEVLFEQDHCTEGEEGTIREIICNEKRLPLPSLVIKFPIDRSIRYQEKENTNITDQQYRTDCILARPYEKITRRFAVTFLKRGYYSIPMIDLVAADFFYVSVFAKKRENESEIYVYPLGSKCKEITYAVNQLVGEYITNRFLYEDPFAFKGIREYVPSDSMHKVNWKASAKTGSLMVNQYYDTNHPSLRIFLDLETEGMLYYEELEEELIRIARTYLEGCMANGIPVELITNGADICTKEELHSRRKEGHAGMEGYLKMLARLDTKEITRPFYQIFETEKKATNEVSVLLSVCQEERLLQAYETYLGTGGSGQWLICKKKEMEEKVASRNIQIIYGEVE